MMRTIIYSKLSRVKAVAEAKASLKVTKRVIRYLLSWWEMRE